MKAPVRVAILKGLQNAMDTTWQKFFNKVAVLDEDNEFTETVSGSAFDGSGEIVPTSGSGWTSGTGCFYSKSFDGYIIVHMYCSGSGTDADGTTLFTLPSGYRPTNAYHTPLIANVGGWSTPGLFYITSGGAAKIYGIAGTGASEISALAMYKTA